MITEEELATIGHFIKNRTLVDYKINKCDGYKLLIFLEYLKPGMTVIDAGAYVGLFTVVFNKLVYPGGRVIAFEPEEENFKGLVQAVNKDDNCVTCVNSALSDYHGRGSLCTSFGEVYPQGHFMIEEDFGLNIDVTYIDKFCKENGISKVDLLKVDVEGQDLKVLQGAESIIDNSENITIIMEIHHGNDKSVLENVSAREFCKEQDISEDDFLKMYDKHVQDTYVKDGVENVSWESKEIDDDFLVELVLHRNRFPSQIKEIHDFFKSKGFRLYDLEKHLIDITDDPVDITIQRITEIVARR